mmetsp:Transcript_79061/g.226664  ORF Transcript_79061/g.226664 Transcript_79061/m.226664 type:complete len:421 (-) Transcript_79061:1028-2290(-)
MCARNVDGVTDCNVLHFVATRLQHVVGFKQARAAMNDSEDRHRWTARTTGPTSCPADVHVQQCAHLVDGTQVCSNSPLKQLPVLGDLRTSRQGRGHELFGPAGQRGEPELPEVAGTGVLGGPRRSSPRVARLPRPPIGAGSGPGAGADTRPKRRLQRREGRLLGENRGQGAGEPGVVQQPRAHAASAPAPVECRAGVRAAHRGVHSRCGARRSGARNAQGRRHRQQRLREAARGSPAAVNGAVRRVQQLGLGAPGIGAVLLPSEVDQRGAGGAHTRHPGHGVHRLVLHAVHSRCKVCLFDNGDVDVEHNVYEDEDEDINIKVAKPTASISEIVKSIMHHVSIEQREERCIGGGRILKRPRLPEIAGAEEHERREDGHHRRHVSDYGKCSFAGGAEGDIIAREALKVLAYVQPGAERTPAE